MERVVNGYSVLDEGRVFGTKAVAAVTVAI